MSADIVGRMRMAGFARAADQAHFGRVRRVHRQYPERADLLQSSLLAAVVLMVAALPAFLLFLNEWRWLPAVLFGVGCLVGGILAWPWYIAAMRLPAHVVTERGVLLLATRNDGVGAAIAWSAVVAVEDCQVTWNDFPGHEQKLRVQHVYAGRDLLAAFRNRGPVPRWTPNRAGTWLVTTAAVLLVFGPVVWLAGVPAAAEVFVGEQPRDVPAIKRLCAGGEPFRGSPAYRGAGPHPMLVVYASSSMYVIGASPPPRESWPAGSVMQLVACGRQIGRAKPDELITCRYASLSQHVEEVYQGRYEYEVREIRTGRRIGAVTVDGDPAPKCAPEKYRSPNDPKFTETDREPTRAQLDAAFGALVDATVPD